MEEEAQNIQDQPQYTVLEQQLIQAVYDCLQNYIPSNASFLAERLLAEKDIEQTRSILAECYMAENKYYKAYHILKQCQTDQNRYKFALVCINMNKLQEAEKALTYQNNAYTNIQIQQQQMNEQVPNGSYGYYLLGIICEKQFKQKEAQKHFQKALELNPNMWTAYEKLCKAGEQIPPNKVFNENHYKQYENNRNQQKQTQQFHNIGGVQKNAPNQQKQAEVRKKSPYKQTLIQMGNQQKMYQDSTNNNNFSYILDDNNSSSQPISSQQSVNHRKHLSLGGYGQGQGQMIAGINPPSLSNLYPKGLGMSQIQQNKKMTASGIQGQQQIQQEYQPQQVQQQQSEINDIWTLFQNLAIPIQNMYEFKCSEAIQAFKKLPQNQYNTGWVLTNIGRCYMEIVKYYDAEKYYQDAVRVEPYRLEGLEYYSACLWQLKKQVELCWLAHNALQKSLFSPETWIIVGNCFSLARENENAIKFFNRAIQLNPNNPYAHCLCGHEYVYNEDFQKAKRSFDKALNLDIRHYNAWWGLGNIYYKQEKYDQAFENFRKSIEINKKNPVLYSFMAMTLSAKGDYDNALTYFKESEKLDPNNGLNKFQKATALVKKGSYKEALKELEQLYQLMPREAPIPMLMGQIYKKLGDNNNAMKYFNLAYDLESKDQQKIKAFIESLHSNGNDFQEELDI